MGLDPEIRAFLERPLWAVLATTNPDGTIQQTLMWYALDGDRIVMNTAAGRRKHRNMQARPDVSVCVTDRYAFVTVRGKATLTVDDPALHRRIGLRYMDEARVEQSFVTQFDHEERVTISISLDHIMARFDD